MTFTFIHSAGTHIQRSAGLAQGPRSGFLVILGSDLIYFFLLRLNDYNSTQIDNELPASIFQFNSKSTSLNMSTGLD